MTPWQSRTGSPPWHAGLHARAHGRTRVEAEPTDPQERGADEGEHHVVGRARVLALAEADAGHQAGDAGIDVHHRAAGKIENLGPCVVVSIREETVSAPDPM